MAAHLLTGMNQVREDHRNPNLWDYLDTAVRFVTWTNLFTEAHFLELCGYIDARRVDLMLEFFDRVEPHYRALWESIGKPTTYEDWQRGILYLQVVSEAGLELDGSGI